MNSLPSNAAADPTQLIAIVGLAARLPGAVDLDAFWELLSERREAIRPVPADRWDVSEQLDPEKRIQEVGGFLDGVDSFDPTFFGISPREAEDIDPQQRLMLEQTWRALEDAGIPASRLHGTRTGVYVGASWHDWEILRKDRGAATTQHTAVGNALDLAATRVSYFLKLRGPSLVVETGCSSALVALHLACQALRAGEIEGAVVGGVNLILTPDVSVSLTHFGGLSPTGRCHAFAAEADGFVRGEGVVAVYIKTVAQALADGDTIRAVIVGTSVNNDAGGESLVTPNPAGQQDLLRTVYDRAGVAADAVDYIEAHGTGTRRGDPIETRAIGETIAQLRSPAAAPLLIGSVKTNIGHLEAAAGLAGMAKVVLALQHRTVPASLHAERLSPDIPFGELNLQVAREEIALPTDRPIHMGVNSFGWGGTNAHVILRSADDFVARATLAQNSGIPAVITLSGHTEAALAARVGQASTVLAAGGDAGPFAGALAHHRDHWPVRLAVTAAHRGQLRDYLVNPDTAPAVFSGRAGTPGRVAFVFPGQGSQGAAMAKSLLLESPLFAAVVERCRVALKPHVDWDLLDVLSGRVPWVERIDIVQPALWAVTLGLAELWRAAGITPDVVIGHSQGEITAATFAGILSYEDAALIMSRRSIIARRASGRGRMLAVDLDIAGANAAIAGFEDTVSVAVNNGPRSCVLSGDTESIEILKELLEAENTFCRLVNVDYASHSPQMDELREDLLVALAEVAPRAGDIAMYSTVLARPVAGTELTGSYWTDNLRRPVLFSTGLNALFDDDVTHVVEISPHPILTPAVTQLAQERRQPPHALTTVRRDQATADDFAQALARAYVTGLAPFGLMTANGARTAPAYPWQSGRFWVPQGRRHAAGAELTVKLVPSASETDLWVGDLEVGVDRSPWLSGHQVHGAVVFPGTGMLALAMVTAAARTGATPGSLRAVTFRSDLTIGSDPARLQVQLREDTTGGGSFALRSLPVGATAWTEHATARIGYGDNPTSTAPLDFPAQLLVAPATDPDQFYADCRARGLEYDGAFRAVHRLFVDGCGALGEIILAANCRPTAVGLHPALWDGALQVALALFAAGPTVVPVSVDEITVHDSVGGPVDRVWSHAVLRDQAVDLCLYDSAQRPLLTMTGLLLQELDVAATDEVEDHFVRLQFRDAAAAEQRPVAGHWHVTGAGDPTVVAAGLQAAGGELVGLEGATDVAFVAPVGADGPELLTEVVDLVRTLSACSTPPRLSIITTDGQTADPAAGLLWGFGRVARREHGELEVRLLDLDSEAPATATEIAAELLAADAPDQVRLSTAGRQVGSLALGRGTPADPVAWQGPRQAWRLHLDRPGWDGLQFRPLSRQAPAVGQLEVEVSASALNFIDVMKVMGTYPDRSAGAERIGGECAGRVIAIGDGVTAFSIGDRVIACQFGSAASHVTVRADHCAQIPDGIDDATAAGLPLVMLTAWYGLHTLAGLRAGETVLVHSAAGGLGYAAIMIARLLGATVLATAGTPAKRAHLHDLGIEHVFDSRGLDWADEVRAATGGRGVDVVLNSLTGAAIPLGLGVLAEDGRFVEVGKKDIYADRTIGLRAFRKSLTLTSVDLAGLMGRRPERFAALLSELWALVSSGELGVLPVQTYPMNEAADAVRAMAKGTHIGKLVLVAPATVTSVTPEPLHQGVLRPDATYLITGGLGALGLSFAAWCADHGARHLTLAGRSEPTPSAAAAIAGLQDRGVTVRVAGLDVAEPASVDVLLRELRAVGPALRGVVHAAGLLDDATIAGVTEQQIHRGLAAKLHGARNLDALTDGDPLDFFVVFSSAAALIGNAGQAVYAAANAAMDTLVTGRRRRGRPGLSVQWGPFDEIGLAAVDANRGARLNERGMGSFNPAAAWAALGALLPDPDVVIGYVPLNLRQWFDANPETAAIPSWQELLVQSQAGSGPAAAGGGELVAALHSSPEGERISLVETAVRQLVGRVLRLDPATVERDIPFKSLGLDSLMSLELRNRLESTFGLTLSPTLLWTYGNTGALSGELCQRLFDSSSSPA